MIRSCCRVQYYKKSTALEFPFVHEGQNFVVELWTEERIELCHKCCQPSAKKDKEKNMKNEFSEPDEKNEEKKSLTEHNNRQQ